MKLLMKGIIAYSIVMIMLLGFTEFTFCQNKMPNNIAKAIIEHCTMPHEPISGHSKPDYSYKSIFVVRVLNYSKNFSTLELSVESAYSNFDILKSLSPFYYHDTDTAIIIFPHIYEKNTIFKDYLKISDGSYLSYLEKNCNFLPFGKKYAGQAYVSIGFCYFRFRPCRNNGIMKYFLTSPLKSVPVQYRLIPDYQVKEGFLIDTVNNSLSWQKFDYFNGKSELEKSMYDKKIKFELQDND